MWSLPADYDLTAAAFGPDQPEPLECYHCGRMFVPLARKRNGRQMTCSRECSHARARERWDRYNRENARVHQGGNNGRKVTILGGEDWLAGGRMNASDFHRSLKLGAMDGAMVELPDGRRARVVGDRLEMTA